MVNEQMLPIRAVMVMTGLSRSLIYQLMQANDFPRPVRMSPRRVAWPLSEVQEFIQHRIAQGRRPTPQRIRLEPPFSGGTTGATAGTVRLPTGVDVPPVASSGDFDVSDFFRNLLAGGLPPAESASSVGAGGDPINRDVSSRLRRG